MVERKRPPGASPITLTPHVEQIATPATAEPQPTVDSPAPTVTSPTAPAPAGAAETEDATAAPKARAGKARSPRREAAVDEPTSVPRPVTDEADDVLMSRTFQFRESLIRRAETAVLRTGGLEGGPRSMKALLNDALERELRRLEDEYNDGAPFPPNRGRFRTGRPIGS